MRRKHSMDSSFQRSAAPPPPSPAPVDVGSFVVITATSSRGLSANPIFLIERLLTEAHQCHRPTPTSIITVAPHISRQIAYQRHPLHIPHLLLHLLLFILFQVHASEIINKLQYFIPARLVCLSSSSSLPLNLPRFLRLGCTLKVLPCWP